MGKKVTPEKYHNDGPIHHRRCRDIFFLIVFLIFWGGMGFVAYFAWQFGSADSIKYGSDSLGNICGINNSLKDNTKPDLTNYTQLYYFNPLSTSSTKVCVQQCPNTTQLASLTNLICKHGITLAGANDAAKLNDLSTQISSKNCAFASVSSRSVVNRCIPNLDATTVDFILSNDNAFSDALASNAGLSLSNAKSIAIQALEDVSNSATEMAIAMSVSLGATFVWVILLRFTASLIVWVLLLGSEAGIIALSVWLYFEWQYKVNALTSIPIMEQTSSEQMMVKAYLGFFITFTSIAVLMFFVIVALRKRVKIAVQIIKESSKAVMALPTLILIPVFMLCLSIALLSLYLIGMLYLSTIDVSKVGADAQFNALAVTDIGNYMQWYWLFGLLWTYFTIKAINQTSIAGSIATWYFTRDKGAIPTFTVAMSVWRCFRYHLGSLAFGSLIIAIFYLVRIVLLYIEKNLKVSQNKFLKFLFACLQCCFACVTRFIAFLNKNAYIEIAIYGKSFCASAKDAFQLLIRNALRLAVVDSVSGFILFFSKLFISSCGTFYLFARLRDNASVSFYTVPLVIVFICSYCIATFFLYIYEMAIDTIFLCFCEDCEKND
ncbi:DUF580-domain-containing protein, partial [Rozella allomycis CSF55]